MSGREAVFFDRDGTLNRDAGYITHLDDFTLLPRAVAAVRKVNEAGMMAVLATNQAGVARGYFPEEMVGRLHEKLQAELAMKEARLDALYYCPYHPDSEIPEYALDSDARKPGPGMLLQAAEEHGIDLSKSYMIGDKYSDLECGWAAGCRSAFILTGYGRGTMDLYGADWRRAPDILAEDVYQAVTMILEEREKAG